MRGYGIMKTYTRMKEYWHARAHANESCATRHHKPIREFIRNTHTMSDAKILDNAELQFDSEATSNDFAGEILAPGDINADGFDDLMFASPEAEYPIGSNHNNHGYVLGIYGGQLSGTHLALDVADFALVGDGNWKSLGRGLALAGDLNTDGLQDIWVADRTHIHLLTSDILP